LMTNHFVRRKMFRRYRRVVRSQRTARCEN
jgi:hypothetical protein